MSDFDSPSIQKDVKAKEEVKPEPKPIVEPAPPPPPKEEPRDEVRPTVILSQTDAYIHDRMKAQPRSLGEVDVKPVSHPGEKHRLSLPPELEQIKKYVFRWIFKSKPAIDDACDRRGWVLVNKSHFPELPKHYFTANGSIERGDNILAFIPVKRAEEIRREGGKLSRERIDATFRRHEDNPNFYRPNENVDGDKRVQMI